jgi:hypothetical protein
MPVELHGLALMVSFLPPKGYASYGRRRSYAPNDRAAGHIRGLLLAAPSTSLIDTVVGAKSFLSLMELLKVSVAVADFLLLPQINRNDRAAFVAVSGTVQPMESW